MKKGEFAAGHAEGDDAGEEKDPGAFESAVHFDKTTKACDDGRQAFSEEGKDQEGGEHDWGKEEDG